MAELRMIAVDAMQPDPDNPNEQDPEMFADLLKSIEDVGFIDAVQVVEKDGHFVILGGEHRWRAAKVSGISEIPAIVVDLDDAERQMQMVRMNMVRGGPNPRKLGALYRKLEETYGEDAVRRKMGLEQDKRFRKLVQDTAQKMGAKVSEKDLDKIESLDDLALVLNTLFTRYGSTLSQHFMMLTFGGKVHMMIQMDDETWKEVQAWAEKMEAQGLDARTELLRVISSS